MAVDLITVVVITVAVILTMSFTALAYRCIHSSVRRNEEKHKARLGRRRANATANGDIEMVAGLPLRTPPKVYAANGYHHPFGERFERRPANIIVPDRR